MPVLFTAVLPPQVTLDLVGEIHEEIGEFSPDGLIAHTVSYDDEAGAVRIVDIWESERARDAFAEATLSPAIQKVTAARGMTPQAPLSVTVSELAFLVTGGR